MIKSIPNIANACISILKTIGDMIDINISDVDKIYSTMQVSYIINDRMNEKYILLSVDEDMRNIILTLAYMMKITGKIKTTYKVSSDNTNMRTDVSRYGSHTYITFDLTLHNDKSNDVNDISISAIGINMLKDIRQAISMRDMESTIKMMRELPHRLKRTTPGIKHHMKALETYTIKAMNNVFNIADIADNDITSHRSYSISFNKHTSNIKSLLYRTIVRKQMKKHDDVSKYLLPFKLPIDMANVEVTAKSDDSKSILTNISNTDISVEIEITNIWNNNK